MSKEYKQSCEFYINEWNKKWNIFHYFLFIYIIFLVLTLIIALLTSIINDTKIGIFLSIISLLVSLWFNKVLWNFIAPITYHQVLCTSNFIKMFVPSIIYSKLFVQPIL